MFPLQLGKTEFEIFLPDVVISSMLPAYLHSLPCEELPLVGSQIRMHAMDEAPATALDVPDQFGFYRARYLRSGNSWDFFTSVPQGPTKPDILPTRSVTPAVLTVLAHQGVLAIHGSAVIRHDKALLFVGPSGSGKSTMADQLSSFGCEFFSEDRVLVWRTSEGIMATPSFEAGNPFGRWVGCVPETGRRPPKRRTPPYGRVAPAGKVYFPEVRPGEESSRFALPRQEAFVRLAASTIGTWDALPEGMETEGLILGTNAVKLAAEL